MNFEYIYSYHPGSLVFTDGTTSQQSDNVRDALPKINYFIVVWKKNCVVDVNNG